MKLLESTIHTIKTEKDSEATFRALVALGNMLTMGNEIKDVANSVYDATSAIHIASGRLRDPRIHRLVAEIQSLI
jgi:phospholipase A-2-activating protein